MNEYNQNPQTLYDVISGQGAIRVSVELSMYTILSIFVAFILAGVVSRLLIQ